MASKWKTVILGRKVLIDDEIVPAAIIVSDDGKIDSVSKEPDFDWWHGKAEQVINAGDSVVIPGVVDSHVHVNEPGRTEWEGFWSATRAAAVGGVTTIVDMPLNCIPPTTTVDNLTTKLEAAKGKIHVDVAFWGGLIPDNKESLVEMTKVGVVGFKCFLCPSGVDEFPLVDESQISEAFTVLEGSETVLAFHAEIECDSRFGKKTEGDGKEYSTFLASRPPEMEIKAVEMVYDLCKRFRIPCHIVHASSDSVLEIVKRAKKEGLPLTAETCHHYLTLDSDTIETDDTRFKCCPPIREKENKEKIWDRLKDGVIDLVVSDHSPCPPQMKNGDFMSAWGGISSLQFGLSLLWTEAEKRGIPLTTVSKLLSGGPAKLCGLRNKGSIRKGMDADLVIFDPEESFVVTEDEILHRHKTTPYLGTSLKGVVKRTVLRGSTVFEKEKGSEFGRAGGEFIFRHATSC